MIKKNICIAIAFFALGICAVYVVWFYQISRTVLVDHATLTQVVEFINKNTQAAQSVTPQP